MRFLTSTDPYVMTEVVEKGPPVDWCKIDAYTQGSLALGTAVKPSPMKMIVDTCIFTHLDVDHIWPRVFVPANLHRHFAARTATFEAASCKNLVMLLKDTNLTANAGLVAFSAFNAHADLKADNIIRMYADLLEKVADPLKGYEKYRAANWDGHGAEAITAATLEYARKLIKALPTTLGTPDVAPAGDGSIALEWIPDHHATLSKLFLDIGPGEEWCAYWKLHDGHFDTVTHEGFHPTTTKAVLQDLFDHLSK
jgi:hypothetical protein